jgi:hypothetical protein
VRKPRQHGGLPHEEPITGAHATLRAQHRLALTFARVVEHLADVGTSAPLRASGGDHQRDVSAGRALQPWCGVDSVEMTLLDKVVR